MRRLLVDSQTQIIFSLWSYSRDFGDGLDLRVERVSVMEHVGHRDSPTVILVQLGLRSLQTVLGMDQELLQGLVGFAEKQNQYHHIISSYF